MVSTHALRAVVTADESTNRPAIQRLTQAWDVAFAPPKALDHFFTLLETHRPDLILVDVDSGPDASLGLCRALKANPTTVNLPVVAMSRWSKARVEAFEAGVDEFVTYQMQRDQFLVRVRALLRLSIARRQLAANQLAEEVQRREEIRAAFRRYLSPNLADRILASPELRDTMFAVPNTRTRAAVMFADMRGFTSISEQLTPSSVVELLNEFFALLTDITFRNEGTVFSMAGDSLLIGFGVPLEQPDGAERAVRTGREMLAKFSALAESWQERFQVHTGLGIGINEGEVIAGNVGSPVYMNYTIIGDTVNVASRLGQRARAGEMLFSDALKRSLDERGVGVDAMALPPLLLRGRSNPIDIFCVPTTQRLDLRFGEQLAAH
jgi:class 3 adenylate cyclase